MLLFFDISNKAKRVTDDVTKQLSLLSQVFPPKVYKHLRFADRESDLTSLIDHQVLCLVGNFSFSVICLFGSTMAQFEAQEHNVTGQIMTTRSNEPASKGWQAFQVIFWTWLTVATVIGNSLVLLCIALKKRRNSSMFKFYGSLALGDLIVGE